MPLAPRACHALSRLDRAWSPLSESYTMWMPPAFVGGEGGLGPSTVSPAFPICFVHVGKCAGGTLKHAMKRIWNISGGFRSTRDITYIHIHNGPVANPKIRQDCLSRKIVLWVRDPMERLMASWRNEVQKWHGEKIKSFMSRLPDVFTKVPPSSSNESSEWPPELFDLNYVAGVVQKHVANGMSSLDADFLDSFHHGKLGLSWYLGLNAVVLDGVPNEQIFVGRVEHMEEDWERFLALMQVPLQSDTKLGHKEVHGTKDLDIPLSSDAVSLLRRLAQPEYACMEKLKVRGLLSADYLDSVVHRTDFVMRRPRPTTGGS